MPHANSFLVPSRKIIKALVSSRTTEGIQYVIWERKERTVTQPQEKLPHIRILLWILIWSQVFFLSFRAIQINRTTSSSYNFRNSKKKQNTSLYEIKQVKPPVLRVTCSWLKFWTYFCFSSVSVAFHLHPTT